MAMSVKERIAAMKAKEKAGNVRSQNHKCLLTSPHLFTLPCCPILSGAGASTHYIAIPSSGFARTSERV